MKFLTPAFLWGKKNRLLSCKMAQQATAFVVKSDSLNSVPERPRWLGRNEFVLCPLTSHYHHSKHASPPKE